jgi:hypothetical protein
MTDIHNGPCSQAFSITSPDGGTAPTDLAIDAGTGAITFVNRADRNDYADEYTKTKVESSLNEYTVTIVNTGGTVNTLQSELDSTPDGVKTPWQPDTVITGFSFTI